MEAEAPDRHTLRPVLLFPSRAWHGARVNDFFFDRVSNSATTPETAQ